MTFDDILDNLESSSVSNFQREALKEAINIQEDITPALLDIVAFSANKPEWLEENPDYMGFTYALFLLAQFRETKVYPLIIKYISHFNNDIHALDAVGDFITEDLSSILASVCGGDLSLIKCTIENPELNNYVRSASLESLVVLYKESLLTRSDLLDYFSSLVDSKLEQKRSYIWSSLVSHCCDIHPEELYPKLLECFDSGYIDPRNIAKNDITRSLKKDKKITLDKLQSNKRLHIITDAVKTMECWACFQEQPKFNNSPNKGNFFNTLAQANDIFPTKINRDVKIGRNDPCPCGSGKKFKKCCFH